MIEAPHQDQQEMSALRTLIVDDDSRFASWFENELQTHFSQSLMIRKALSAAEARECFEKWQPSLLFLDIEMPGENGFELLESLSSHPFDIVFTTGHEGYALRAIKANALDYLLKPVKQQDLKISVEKALKTHYPGLPKADDGSIKQLIEEINGTSSTPKISISHTKGLTIVDIDQIIHLEAQSNYTLLHLLNGNKIMATGCLKEYGELLESNEFIRIHKSHIIRIQSVKAYSTEGVPYVTLCNGKSIEVSRRRKEYFLDCLRKISLSI